MAYERKHGDFTLRKSKTKKTEKSADYGGKILLDGKEYWLNAWMKISDDGERWFSGRLGNPVETAAGFGGGTGFTPKKADPLDDDAPW
jgi:hypothetical protein